MRKWFDNKTLILLIVIALVLRLYQLADHYPGIDESLTFDIAVDLQGEGYGFGYFHPPLFFILMNALSGWGVFFPRLLMVVFSILTMVVAYMLAKDIFDERTGIVVAALLAFNPMSLVYAQHARPYAILMFLYMASLFFLHRLIARFEKRQAFFLAATYIAAIYIHFISVFFIAGQFLTVMAIYFLGRKRLLDINIGMRWFLLSIAIAGLSLLPLIYNISGSYSSYSQTPKVWFGDISPGGIIYPFYKFSVMSNISATVNFPYVLFLFPLIGILFIYGMIRMIRERVTFAFLASNFFLVFIIYLLFSLYIPIYYFRYLSYLLPLFLIFVARGIDLEKKRFQVILALILISWVLVDLYYYSVSLTEGWGWLIGV